MLFSEFTEAIKEERYPFYTSQRENGISRLYKQYEIIEALYMESGSMSKEEAYNSGSSLRENSRGERSSIASTTTATMTESSFRA